MAPKMVREEVVNALVALGIDLPPGNKITEEHLKKRLSRALDCAQLFSQRLPSATLDPAALSAWTGSLYAKFTPGSVMENTHLMSLMQSDRRPSEERDVFYDMREAIACLGHVFDQGGRFIVLQDEGQMSAICVRVIDVLKLNDRTPVMILSYDRSLRGSMKPSMVQFLDTHFGRGLVDITTSVRGQQLLLRLLSLNSLRIPASYKPSRQPYETDYRLSFLMPTGPLSMTDIGTMNEEKGCELCGGPATKRCSACESVVYCGKACQSEGWPSHKKQCHALSKGTWSTMRFQSQAAAMPMFEGHYSANINRYTRSDGEELVAENHAPLSVNSPPPPNVHANRPFVLKIQSNPVSIRIYDRRRSVDLFLMIYNDPINFKKLCEATSTGFRGIKCYRWAKRVSDWELSICLDRKLAEDPKW
ncbi:hypothetical protein SISNIDRAFT_452975 [Sistotremastrum niveocremeum HHB9708]|uniref:MYND-type domain-containing protein n=1 Tax=Sistotremastrum niveocremeum HHB9708 TaxID=1314777 RepID=A0A164W8U4_9AGAM|nr:hypothetical protein SISNIDRAFT_452975 [Sistotremastrum niveocremeum HHB9708]